MPSFKSLGLDVRADVSMLLVTFLVTLGVLGILHGEWLPACRCSRHVPAGLLLPAACRCLQVSRRNRPACVSCWCCGLLT